MKLGSIPLLCFIKLTFDNQFHEPKIAHKLINFFHLFIFPSILPSKRINYFLMS